MLILIKNIQVYQPENIGKKDVLIAGEHIYKIDENILIDSNVKYEVIDGTGKILFPGFIDNHVHIAGGGGEGGFTTRTPEICLDDIIKGGITTIIGTLGTDGFGRSMENLLAKAIALDEYGITTFVNTGSYQIPIRTLTGSISKDIMFNQKIIGVGEVAISDHRSSCPNFDDLAKICSEARVAGMLSGKRGAVNFHVGDGKDCVDLLEELVEKTNIPIGQFVPTHMNRSGFVFEKGLKYLAMGGNLDFTTSTVPQFIEEGEIPCAKAVKIIIEKLLDISKVTFSSDGQGSLPLFDEKGNTVGVEIGRVTSLYEAVVECIKDENIPISQAISIITANPARIFNLKGKGQVKEGFHGDLVIVDQNNLEIETVIAKGQIMMREGEVLVKSYF